jgi:hypothetical protein
MVVEGHLVCGSGSGTDRADGPGGEGVTSIRLMPFGPQRAYLGDAFSVCIKRRPSEPLAADDCCTRPVPPHGAVA